VLNGIFGSVSGEKKTPSAVSNEVLNASFATAEKHCLRRSKIKDTPYVIMFRCGSLAIAPYVNWF